MKEFTGRRTMSLYAQEQIAAMQDMGGDSPKTQASFFVSGFINRNYIIFPVHELWAGEYMFRFLACLMDEGTKVTLCDRNENIILHKIVCMNEQD